MLLGAARYLAETRNFDGTVYLIFQPAEEGEGGGRVMIEEGLFERFPIRRVFGMHNWPGRPVGSFAMRKGPIMAAADRIQIEIKGQGGHAAAPHLCRDPLVAAAQIISSLQTIVSRSADPIGQAVVSLTYIRGGDAFNVIPESVSLGGTARSFEEDMRLLLERRIIDISTHVGKAYGVEVETAFRRGYPPTVNSDLETDLAAEAAIDVVGAAMVEPATPPVMGGEDFAYMLNERPGSYIFIGNGGGDAAPMLHNAAYDFNDEVLPVGASYWARLVERLLPAMGQRP
jgi:hippurate hydrolase